MNGTTAHLTKSKTLRWQKQWRRDNLAGIRRMTDASRAKEHVQALATSLGVSSRAIADASGVSRETIALLNRGVAETLYVTTEQRILAVKAEDILNRPNHTGYVPNIGARRRVQALMAIGWRHQDLSPRLGFVSTNLIHQQGDWITQRKHQAVKDLYDQLWNKPRPEDVRSRNRAAKAGYAPPLAWDDETIDDPAATPDLGAKVYAQGRSPEGAVRYSDAIVENTDFLIRSGIGWAGLPERLGISTYALERALHRAGRGDLVTQAKAFEDRREYARAS